MNLIDLHQVIGCLLVNGENCLARKLSVKANTLKQVKDQAGKYYQEYIESSKGKKAYKEMQSKYPDYNTTQSAEAADFIMTKVRNWLSNTKKLSGNKLSDLIAFITNKVREGIA